MSANNQSGNQSGNSGRSLQASGRQGKNPASHTPRGAAVDKSAQRRGGQHSHGGR
ncbi:MAG TPA: hypothetical protein VLV87_04425 [Gammaproteobacteria bacterium]|nr:hypothetical protein [Gammaproteobacteria bacterium]